MGADKWDAALALTLHSLSRSSGDVLIGYNKMSSPVANRSNSLSACIIQLDGQSDKLLQLRDSEMDLTGCPLVSLIPDDQGHD